MSPLEGSVLSPELSTATASGEAIAVVSQDGNSTSSLSSPPTTTGSNASTRYFLSSATYTSPLASSTATPEGSEKAPKRKPNSCPRWLIATAGEPWSRNAPEATQRTAAPRRTPRRTKRHVRGAERREPPKSPEQPSALSTSAVTLHPLSASTHPWSLVPWYFDPSLKSSAQDLPVKPQRAHQLLVEQPAHERAVDLGVANCQTEHRGLARCCACRCGVAPNVNRQNKGVHEAG